MGFRYGRRRPPKLRFFHRLCPRQAIVLERGRIVQKGTWNELCSAPATPLLRSLLRLCLSETLVGRAHVAKQSQACQWLCWIASCRMRLTSRGCSLAGRIYNLVKSEQYRGLTRRRLFRRTFGSLSPPRNDQKLKRPLIVGSKVGVADRGRRGHEEWRWPDRLSRRKAQFRQKRRNAG